MKVVRCPKGFEEPGFDAKDWQKAEADHTARLKKHFNDFGHNGDTGEVIGFGVADGSAQYMYVEGGGRYGKSSFLVHLSYGDGYQYMGVNRFTKADILKMVKQGKARTAMFKRADDWWEDRKVGEIVHYSNGFGSYVRGEIVVATKADTKGNFNSDDLVGKKAMKEIALVGDWKSHDLPSRFVDGTIHYGHHAEGVLNGKVMRPHESNMYEANISKKDASSRELAARHPADPRKMKPVSLELPPMTDAEIALADAVKLRNKMIEALNNVGSGKDFTLANVKRAVRAAAKLAETV